ncbi:MAG: hemopexin repeat-containing protein, partial [Bacteroidota bacterium]
MSVNQKLPDYENLFGIIQAKAGDEARSVYSPAAYLADLLQLLGDRFTSPDFLSLRRPDVKGIPLDGGHTFDLVPYLEVVNRILATRIAGEGMQPDAAYQILKEAAFPLNLPFDQEAAQYRMHLAHLGLTSAELFQAFSTDDQSDEVVFDQLGLTQDQVNWILQAGGHDFKAVSGLDGDASPGHQLSVASFLKATNLSAQELYALLYGELSERAQDPDGNLERDLAKYFYTNLPFDGAYVTLDDAQEYLQWSLDPDQAIPDEWYDRAQRVIRLAQATGEKIADLYLLIQLAASHELSLTALRSLALIKVLQDRFDLNFRQALLWMGELQNAGMGDQDQPSDLFNQTYNGRMAGIDQSYLTASDFLPEAYEGYAPIRVWGDILSEELTPLRRRIQAALGMSSKDLEKLVNRFREEAEGQSYVVFGGDTGLKEFELMLRISYFTEHLDLALDDLFLLLEIIGGDPLVKSEPPFRPWIKADLGDNDCFFMLVEGSPEERTWLIQLLLGMTDWMKSHELNASDLYRITTGKIPYEKALEKAQQEFIRFLNEVIDAFMPTAFDLDQLRQLNLSPQAQRQVYETLLSPNHRLTLAEDSRVLTLESSRLEKACYEALTTLDQVRVHDFTGLNLSSKWVDELYQNLIQQAYLDIEGHLIPANWPDESGKLRLETDFSEETPALFELIYELYQAQREEIPEEDAVELSLFPSDLIPLGLSANGQGELLRRLILLGFMDEDGQVQSPDFFREKGNASRFDLASGLGELAQPVFDLVEKKRDQFSRAQLKVDATWFDALAFSTQEKEELVQNLIFNAYLDEEGKVQDKEALLGLELRDFDLALVYYPHRRAILGRLQSALLELQGRFYQIQPDSLEGLLDEFVAQRIFDQTQASLFPQGRLIQQAPEFYADPAQANGLKLDASFGESASSAIMGRLGQKATELRRFRFDSDRLDEWSFSAEEKAELQALLIEQGFLLENGSLPYERLAYFSQINHALEFSLPEFEDYQKDLFFLLRELAQGLSSLMEEVSNHLEVLAHQQALTLFEVLQENLELDLELTRIIFPHFFPAQPHSAAAFYLPLLQAKTGDQPILELPPDPVFVKRYQRMWQFAHLTRGLGLSARDAQIVFDDQLLSEKFPEPLVLPPDVDRIEVLWEAQDGHIYLFVGDRYWRYDRANYELVDPEEGLALAELSPWCEAWTRVDGAYTDDDGNDWLFSAGEILTREPSATDWEPSEREWGKIQGEFANLERVRATFRDQAGFTYLLTDTEYVRYRQGYEQIDQGYPRSIDQLGELEGEDISLPDSYGGKIDAAFQDEDGQAFFFRQGTFIGSEDPTTEKIIASHWGKVKNNFAGTQAPTASLVDGPLTYFFLGDQIIAYRDSLENPEPLVQPGFPQKIADWLPGLPEAFTRDLDAAFRDLAGNYFFFKEREYVEWNTETGEVARQSESAQAWGHLRNEFQTLGQEGKPDKIDAALMGLDGKTYLFCGDQYIRYSASNYKWVDEGYPRLIADDWGGLHHVSAAFVLDGKTYVFGLGDLEGETEEKLGQELYVRYSTRDYSSPDEDFPKEVNDHWWNLPVALTEQGFDTPDAIFVGALGDTFLFKGTEYISYQHLERWWSDPKPIAEYFDSLPFDRVDAAFRGKDGRTYLFSGEQYARYEDDTYQRLDDRFPQPIVKDWGKVANNLAKTGRVDAALTLLSAMEEEREDGSVEEWEEWHTYLFSGNQFYRYSAGSYDVVQQGYPLSTGKNLRKEPRFTKLIGSGLGLRLAFADQAQVFLGTEDGIEAMAVESIRSYDPAWDPGLSVAFKERGSIYAEVSGVWMQLSHLENEEIEMVEVGLPPLLRGVPDEWKHELDAVLLGKDGHSCLFKAGQCFHLGMERAYDLTEEWGRVNNHVALEGRVDAGFTAADGRTYVFSKDQFLVYEQAIDLQSMPLASELPQQVSEHWAGLGQVDLAYRQEGQTFLFEKLPEAGRFRLVVYQGDGYQTPEAGYPREVGLDYWGLPEAYQAEGFDAIDAIW